MNLDDLQLKFYNVGLSYKKADVNVRGVFNITKEDQVLLLKEAKENGCEGLFVVSTCNRTEITGFAKHPFELISLLVKYSKGNLEDFINVSNVIIRVFFLRLNTDKDFSFLHIYASSSFWLRTLLNFEFFIILKMKKNL